jgi:hypothetical protein
MKGARQIPDGFATRIAGPFYVIGDESAARVDHYTHTIDWTVGHLKTRLPHARAAERHRRLAAGQRTSYVEQRHAPVRHAPSTPYGFFLPSTRRCS